MPIPINDMSSLKELKVYVVGNGDMYLSFTLNDNLDSANELMRKIIDRSGLDETKDYKDGWYKLSEDIFFQRNEKTFTFKEGNVESGQFGKPCVINLIPSTLLRMGIVDMDTCKQFEKELKNFEAIKERREAINTKRELAGANLNISHYSNSKK